MTEERKLEIIERIRVIVHGEQPFDEEDESAVPAVNFEEYEDGSVMIKVYFDGRWTRVNIMPRDVEALPIDPLMERYFANLWPVLVAKWETS